MLLYSWNHAKPLPPRYLEVEGAPNLDALLASVLASFIEQRLRRGLGKSYADADRTIRGVRGRILFAESVRAQLFERYEAHCRFPEFTVDVPRNRIIKAVLRRVLSASFASEEKTFTPELRHRVRTVIRGLRNVCDIEPSLSMISRETFGRSDSDYRLMLNICELLIRRALPTESTGETLLPGIARDEAMLAQLFERFVARFYVNHLTEWAVSAQRHLLWSEATASNYLPNMVADVQLVHRASGRVVFIDTKFTASSLPANQFGQRRFSSPHLYQIYTYLRTQEHLSERHADATGILLYPRVDIDLHERVSIQGHSIRVETVDLTKPWTTIEERLLRLLTEA